MKKSEVKGAGGRVRVRIHPSGTASITAITVEAAVGVVVLSDAERLQLIEALTLPTR